MGLLGKCVVTDAKLSGYCIGTRGGVCREAYDPTNCPPKHQSAMPRQTSAPTVHLGSIRREVARLRSSLA